MISECNVGKNDKKIKQQQNPSGEFKMRSNWLAS